MMLNEHKFKPFKGNFLSLGRQTIVIKYDSLLSLFSDYEIDNSKLKKEFSNLTKDEVTKKSFGNIRDDSLIKTFSDCEYTCVDVSGYEEANIIQDLNKPIPEELENKFDVIFSGGVFDNIFDPVTALRNAAKMLKPKGRLIITECATAQVGAYLMFSPEWFYSYFAINNFNDCRAYVYIARESQGEQHMFNTDLFEWDPYFQRDPNFDYIKSGQSVNGIMYVTLIAEKREDSTYDKTPMQSHYFSAGDTDWRSIKSHFRKSGRKPPLIKFKSEKIVTPLLTNHFTYIGSGF